MRRHTNTSRIWLLTALLVVLVAVPVTAQMDWRDLKLAPSDSPAMRKLHAVAFDQSRQQVVLFGGCVGASSTLLGDTWVLNGHSWGRPVLTTTPPAREAHAMAYDASRSRIVLFGGTGATGLLNDTWEWDGAHWKNVTPTKGSPPARRSFAMTYDAARRKIVLFGGDSGTLLNDTWEWDGSAWKNVTPQKGSPAVRRYHAMAYDARRQSVVLFGGYGSGFMNDTWEWRGATWSQVTTKTSPQGRARHAMAYDAARQTTVVFGGWQVSSVVYGDTWEWDGSNWSQAAPKTSPSTRHSHAMAHDPQSGRTILFGGCSGTAVSSPPDRGDTCEYACSDLTVSAHQVPVSTGGTVQLGIDASTKRAAKNYWVIGCIDGTGIRGMDVADGVRLRLYPDAYFLLTATLPNVLISNSCGVLDKNGKATATLNVPPLSSRTIGTCFYHAYVVWAGSTIEYASTPLPLTLVK